MEKNILESNACRFWYNLVPELRVLSAEVFIQLTFLTKIILCEKKLKHC
jgi:hypothetical protein